MAGKAGATVRIEGSSWMKQRARILERDGYLCLHCKAKDRLTLAQEVDHIKPLEQGGSYEDSNLSSLCKPCHQVKTKGEQLARVANKYGGEQ